MTLRDEPSLAALARPGVANLPVYEPGKPVETLARELGLGSADGLTKLASNENALGPSPLAVKAMQQAAAGVHRYPEGSSFYLREALAQRLQLSAAQVMLGNGSNELLELLAHVFLSPATGAVASEKAFVVYRLVCAAAEAPLREAPMTGLTHDVEALLDAVTENTRLLFVANPNNPTGTMVGQDELDHLMERVPGHVVVVIDEAYIDLLPPERRPDTLSYVRDGRRVFLLRTFSKAYGLAGLRVGYALAPEEGIDLLHRVRQPFNINAMAQAAALAALDDDVHLARTSEMVQNGLARLEAGCKELGLDYVPSVVNFMLVRVGQGRVVFEALQREGVIVRPMDVYDLPDYIRVTVGTPEENERFLSALRTVGPGA